MNVKTSSSVVERTRAWRSSLAVWTSGFLLFEGVSGLAIWLLPFSIPNQVMVIVHTAAGVLFTPVCLYYLVRHWSHYRRQMMTHIKLQGYLALVAVALGAVSGFWLTFQALFATRISYLWDGVHIVTTFGVAAFVGLHLGLIVVRDFKARVSEALAPVLQGMRAFGWGTLTCTLALFLIVGLGAVAYQPIQLKSGFDPDYSYPYGEDRPFAPSLARTETGGAFDARLMSGSQGCGTAGCHEQIAAEWGISAHRWSAMDAGFQKIQYTMAEQNGPESTRYCGGCHDPISLFSGTKNIFTDPDKLSSLAGYQEGVSCLVCHAVRETDLKGNAHYVLARPVRYMFEMEYDREPGQWHRLARDFLIRAYPRRHVSGLSKTLFKAPEYCAACHKQFIDEEVNNVGWVQLQNQYDNWRKSRWNHPENPLLTIECRECHMPLVDSSDPASGDSQDFNRTAGDGKHRSHRFVAANQLMPALLKLEGWEEQIALTERWLKGEFPIPEIAGRWVQGPAVSIELMAPETARPGEEINLRAVITSNKVGHDFPTGPLDIIQAWVELTVVDQTGKEVFVTGRVDEKGFIQPGSYIFKAEPVDQYGNLIDRHNLWEMVGVRQRRALFPGFSDTAGFALQCPAQTALPSTVNPKLEDEKAYRMEVPEGFGGALQVTARLKYRKIDQYLLNFLFGDDAGLTSPVTEMSSDQATILIAPAAGDR